MGSLILRRSAIVAGATAGVALADRDRRDAVRGVTSGAVRFGRAFGYATVVSLDFKYSLRDLERGSEEYEAVKKKVNLRSAHRLLKVCSAHGGVYTKFGQHIASMNHVLPKEYTETLKVLQDRNPSVGVQEVERTVKAELGAEIRELFREFDEQAIAAASLAQVHRAVTKCGKEVAVKLQYPGLENQVQKDLLGMRFLATLMGRVFPEYEYTWLFPDFEETINLELDFVQEGTNAERVARMFRDRPDVFIPPIHWEYSSRRVLTMDFVHGTKITEKEAIEAQGMDPALVARTVTRSFGEMMYCHGFVHCDPHPGNLMVRPIPSAQTSSTIAEASLTKRKGNATAGTVAVVGGDGAANKRDRSAPKPKSVAHQVVLLDHGMYRRLDPGFRHTYARLWKAFMTRNQKLGQQCAVDLGVEPDFYDALSLILTWRPTTTNAQLGARISEEERQALARKYKTILTPDTLNEFLERLPRDMLFVMRTSDLIRSLNKELGGTSKQRLITLAECAIRGLSIPNPPNPNQRQDGFVSVSDALGEEKDFREFLEREGVVHPAKLALSQPLSPVNRLVSSERGMVAGRLSWWDWLDLRVRIWVLDGVSRLIWWWLRKTSFTDRDIG